MDGRKERCALECDDVRLYWDSFHTWGKRNFSEFRELEQSPIVRSSALAHVDQVKSARAAHTARLKRSPLTSGNTTTGPLAFLSASFQSSPSPSEELLSGNFPQFIKAVQSPTRRHLKILAGEVSAATGRRNVGAWVEARYRISR